MSTCMHVTMTATTIAATTATSKLSNNKSPPHSTAMFNPTAPPHPPPQTTTAPTANLIGPDIASNTPIISSNHHGPPHYVDLHVNAGECISLQLLDGQEQVLTGPATITMISQQQSPPVPIPVQVPPGHMVHQIADENGTLKHIILSVMVNEENSHLNSAVISLPHGNFRINSLGELVNVGSDIASDRDSPNQLQDQASIAQATSSTNSSNAPTIHHLAQQQQQTSTYFANYDNCSIANYDTTLAGYAAHHYSNQSAYNGIMSNSYHHESTSPSSYKNSPSLLSHPAPIMSVAPATGSYPFAYSSFNQIQSHQTTTMTSVSSSGKQSNSHRKNATTSNVHQAAAAYKANDNNENNLSRSKRGDSQVAAQNHLNGNLISSHPNLNTRHQHNEINPKRQPQHLVGLDESNKYNSNTRIPVGNQPSNMNISGSGPHHNHHNHHHHHHNRNFRSSGGGNNGPLVNSRVGRLRGTYNNHHHQNHSATPYNLRNNYNSFNGNATQETPSIGNTDVLCSIQAAKEVKPVNSTPSPNLSSPTSKQQQQQPISQRSPTNISKNRSSSPTTEEASSIVENASNIKRSENKTSNTTKEVNIKQKPEIELETSEIVKCSEHLNNLESPLPPRNSRGKHKKCHEDSAKQSNEQPNQKLRQSTEDSIKASADSLRSRSVNDDNKKITANGMADNKAKMKFQRKNSSQQENNKQMQSNKTTNTSEISSIIVASDKVLKTLQIDKEIAVDVQPIYAVETKEVVANTTIVDSGSPMVAPKRIKARESVSTVIEKVDSSNPPKSKQKQIETPPKTIANPVSNHSLKSESPSRKKSSSHNHHHHHHPVKFSTLVKQCRNKFVTTFGTLVQSSLSSCSDTKFAGLLLILFTVVAMLLAIIIHLYIV